MRLCVRGRGNGRRGSTVALAAESKKWLVFLSPLFLPFGLSKALLQSWELNLTIFLPLGGKNDANF